MDFLSSLTFGAYFPIIWLSIYSVLVICFSRWVDNKPEKIEKAFYRFLLIVYPFEKLKGYISINK